MDVPPPVAGPVPPAEARAALFRVLADGERHAVADLARLAPGGTGQDAVAWVVAESNALGIPLRHDEASVRSLPSVPLDQAAIARRLGEEDALREWEVRVVFSVGSTNSELLREVRHAGGRVRPRILVAESQAAGRGRLGRGWMSTPGRSLTASFALHLDRTLSRLDGVTLVCGLAVHRVVLRDRPCARLKWPNDILVDGQKLAGILVETHPAAAGTTLVIGVGINVAAPVSRIAAARTKDALPLAVLCDDPSRPVDRNRLVSDIAQALAAELAGFETGGFATFMSRWNAVDAYAGRHVTLHVGRDMAVAGIARGVDDSGALLLDVAGERRRVIAGDVSLRAMRHETGCETA